MTNYITLPAIIVFIDLMIFIIMLTMIIRYKSDVRFWKSEYKSFSDGMSKAILFIVQHDLIEEWCDFLANQDYDKPIHEQCETMNNNNTDTNTDTKNSKLN